jgi:2'-5' RNA ligase
MNEDSAPTIFFTLYFDTTTEDNIRDVWQRLAQSGVRVPGLTGLRPHVTLAACATDAIGEHCAMLADFVQRHAAFPIGFEHLGIFPGSRVVFLAPRITAQLTHIQAALVRMLAAADRTTLKFAEHLAPDNWIAHCTLVMGSAAELSTAISSLLAQPWEPIVGMVAGIGIVVAPDVDDLVRYPFGHGGTATSIL